MCLGCWKDVGSPYRASDTALEWAPKFADADHFGALHIIIEDWNLNDENLEFCRTCGPDQNEVALLDALSAMTIEERWATAILSDDPTFRPELLQ